MSGSDLPDPVSMRWGIDDARTPILHVDMDSFFAAVEQAEDPSLRAKPLIVGGVGNRGVVTSATYEARARGVRAGMPINRARSLCPDAIVLPGRHDLYRDYSTRAMKVLASVTPIIEQISIDEAFLDVSGAKRRLGSPVEIAKKIRERIRTDVGIPASVGIAESKSVAKIASAHAKPDGWLLISQEQTVAFLHSLPIGALWGVGKKTEEVLNRRGIDSVSDLAHTEINDLTRWVGAASAVHLHDLSWGRDPRSVGSRAREKSISTERTFATNLVSRIELERFVLDASHQCAHRLRQAGLLGWTVTLKLRDEKFTTITRSRTLLAPTDVGKIIAESALLLCRNQKIPSGGIRLAGVGVSSLVTEDDGIPVLLTDDPRNRNTEYAMDRVAQRFGKGAVKPASLLGTTLAE